MKKYWSVSLLTLALMACSGSSTPENLSNTTNSDTLPSGIIEYDLNEEKLSAVDFSNELSLYLKNVWDQLDLMFTAKPDQIEDQLNTTIFEINTKLSNLEKMNPPEGGEEMVEALTTLFKFYEAELSARFQSLLPLLKKPVEELTAQESAQLESFDKAFAEKEKELSLIFFEKQSQFAEANNFTMQEI